MIAGKIVPVEVYECFQRETSKLVKERDKAEEKAKIYKIGLIVCGALLALTAYDNYRPITSWFPDEDKNCISCTRHGWFKTTITPFYWRADVNGEQGWCCQENDGKWYKMQVVYPDPPERAY
jgi:hypothetical protein